MDVNLANFLHREVSTTALYGRCVIITITKNMFSESLKDSIETTIQVSTCLKHSPRGVAVQQFLASFTKIVTEKGVYDGVEQRGRFSQYR